MATIESIPLAEISESPLNPRKTFDEAALRELADDVARRGILQPVLVRPVDDPTAEVPYELVFGARRLRAAKAAGLEEVPAMVRNLTDAEVLEIQIVENAKRADVHPLEEAEAYEALHEHHGHDVDEIAAKVGRSRAYVYGRMKLLALCPAGRQAYYDGRLTASTALYVARIPSEDLQAKAVEDLLMMATDGPVPAREASRRIRQFFMLSLAGATFATDDAKLVKAAGPCTTCPKRTGNQAALFADIEEADLCTDPFCYRKKEDADWKKTAAAARRRGLAVLTDAQAAEVFPYDWSDRPAVGSPYVAFGDYCPKDPRGRTYAQLLGDEPAGTVLARTPARKVMKLFPRADIDRALEAAGVDLTPAEPEAPAATAAAAPSRQRDPWDEAADRALSRAMGIIVSTIEARGGLTRDVLLGLSAGVEEPDALYAPIHARRGWDEDHAVGSEITAMSDGQLAGLVVEKFLAEEADYYQGQEAGPMLAAVAEILDVSLGDLEEKALAEVQAERGEKEAA